MATTDDRLFRHADEVEREATQEPVIDQDADRPKSGVLGFGATVSTYFVAAVALAVVMVLVIVLFAM